MTAPNTTHAHGHVDEDSDAGLELTADEHQTDPGAVWPEFEHPVDPTSYRLEGTGVGYDQDQAAPPLRQEGVEASDQLAKPNVEAVDRATGRNSEAATGEPPFQGYGFESVPLPAHVAAGLRHSREVYRGQAKTAEALDTTLGPASTANHGFANGDTDSLSACTEEAPTDDEHPVVEVGPSDGSVSAWAGRMVTPFIAAPALVVVVAIVVVARPSLGLAGVLLLAGSVPPMTLMVAELITRGWRP